MNSYLPICSWSQENKELGATISEFLTIFQISSSVIKELTGSRTTKNKKRKIFFFIMAEDYLNYKN